MANNLGVSIGTDATVRTIDNASVHLNVSAIADTTGANIGSVDSAGNLAVATNKAKGAPNIATNQKSVTTSATKIVDIRAARRRIAITLHAATDTYFGADNTVTTGNGFRVKGVDGATLSLDVTGEVWAIVGAGSVTVSYLEVYD